MLNLENKFQGFLIHISTLLGISSAIAGIVEFVGTNKLTPVIIIYFLTFLIFIIPNVIHLILSLKFRAISETTFINKLDFRKIDKVLILAHTGRVMFDAIFNKLIKLNDDEIPREIRVLVRTRLIESMDRNEYIRSTITKVNNLREKLKIHRDEHIDELIDIRFYEAIPSIRGIICEDQHNRRLTFSTAYYWEKPNKSSSFGYAFVIKDKIDKKKKQVELLESWIDQYWGRDEIHTIVFDFDDTLVPSMDLQIKAWIKTIEKVVNKVKYKDKLIDSLKVIIDKESNIVTNENFYNVVKNIFIEHQLAEVIIDNLFKELDDSEVKEINELRFETREELLAEVEPFDGLHDRLSELHEHHNFAIITSTDERMVRNYLHNNNLLKYFTNVLGKNDPSLRYERDNIYNKSYLILKLSEIIGIPLNRMIYVGDNNSDYKATRQIGIDFIEAKMAALNVGKTSLIKIDDFNKKLPIGYINNYTSHELNSIIEKRSSQRRIKKYQFKESK